MERFRLPRARTILSGSAVASVVSLCDENNLRRVVASTASLGVLGVRPAPNWAPAPPAPQTMPSPCTLVLNSSWRALRRGDVLRATVAVSGAGTLAAALFQGGVQLGQHQVALTGAGWKAAPLLFTVPARADYAHGGDLQVRLTWTGTQWAGAVVQRVRDAFEVAALVVPGGVALAVGTGMGVAPSYRWVSAPARTGLDAVAGGTLCVWAELAPTDGILRAVVQGFDQGTSTPTEQILAGEVKWGPQFPSGDIVQIATVEL